MAKLTERVEDIFELFAGNASRASGSIWAFGLAVLVIAAWALAGPPLGFSESWQLLINSLTTIVTFLMVFLIQHSQNKETRAIQLKLNELLAAMEGASNRLIDVEELTDRELAYLYRRFQHLARTADRLEPGAATSIDAELRQWNRNTGRGARAAERRIDPISAGSARSLRSRRRSRSAASERHRRDGRSRGSFAPRA